MDKSNQHKVCIFAFLALVVAFCGCSGGSKGQSYVPMPPLPASNPSPADAATGVFVTSDLSWGMALRATSYDVYVGTSEAAVTNADRSSAEYQGEQTALSFDYPGNFNYSATYYWRVDSINNIGTTKGAVWHFDTEDPPVDKPLKATNPRAISVMKESSSRSEPLIHPSPEPPSTAPRTI